MSLPAILRATAYLQGTNAITQLTALTVPTKNPVAVSNDFLMFLIEIMTCSSEHLSWYDL